MASIYKHRIKLGLSDVQKESLDILKSYGVNTNQFIRQAIKEKISRDWKEIKQNKVIRDRNIPQWVYK